MRRFTKKRARINRQANPLRDEYRAEFPQCQACLEREATELHEIARGGGIRVKALTERCTWLHLCQQCHRDFGNYRVWPVERQLALKMLVDPVAFDAAAVNELRGRHPDAIGIVEIARYLQLRLGSSNP